MLFYGANRQHTELLTPQDCFGTVQPQSSTTVSQPQLLAVAPLTVPTGAGSGAIGVTGATGTTFIGPQLGG
ncbi:MAG: hypothetical protein LBC38_00825, partial [Oscillospiraceae bacterium]|nr:hypothetical protein [Oscillospiraceae bacterium]